MSLPGIDTTMVPETEDSVVDFDWIDDHSDHQENFHNNTSEHSERKKELLRKLNKRRNPLSHSVFSPPLLSGIRRRESRDNEKYAKRESEGASVRNAEDKLECSGGGPVLSELQEYLKQDCIHHPTNQTKYFCNDCKIFICIQCIAFGEHGRPHQVSNEEDSRYTGDVDFS